jgi:hypothetical protein
LIARNHNYQENDKWASLQRLNPAACPVLAAANYQEIIGNEKAVITYRRHAEFMPDFGRRRRGADDEANDRYRPFRFLRW